MNNKNNDGVKNECLWLTWRVMFIFLVATAYIAARVSIFVLRIFPKSVIKICRDQYFLTIGLRDIISILPRAISRYIDRLLHYRSLPSLAR